MNNNCGRLEYSKLSGTVSDVIKPIDERLEYYVFHGFIKQAQAASFVERKGNLKIGQALFHFDSNENYPFVPQDEIQSRHWAMLSALYIQQWFASKTPKTIF